MRIERVEARWVRVPIATDKQHRSDFGQVTSFDSAIVRIDTDGGITGWGEGKNAAGSSGAYAGLVHLINSEIAPMLVGRDPRDVGVIWETLYNGVRHETAAVQGHVMPQLARRGLTIAAISAIDIALWDIFGKALGEPVWRLLGGRKAERMAAYASGGWAPVDRIGEQLKEYVEAGGFSAVKMRVGAMDGPVQVSAERVRRARETLGPDIDIMVDAHGTYTVAEAKRFAELVRDQNIAWFEEPVTADDKPGIVEVRAACNIPIACGESEATRFAFRDLAVLRAADILQPDLGYCGGITEGAKIAALAASFNLRLAPHLWAGAPAFFAGLHLCAASAASYVLEYSLGANPMLHELVEESVDLKEGTIAIPERPGLGITVCEAFLHEYTVAN